MNLEQILENPGGCGYPHHADLSEKELDAFAKKRAHYRTRVSELLADLDPAKLGDKYAWIPEYLSIRGNTKVNLVNLLVDQKYDGPFIYRTDNDTSGLMSNVQSTSSSSSTAGKTENKNSATSKNSMGKKSLSSKASTSSSSIRPSESPEAPRRDQELGIAGFLPVRGPPSSLEHEYWLRDISRHVEIITPWSDGAEALQLSIVLGHRDPKPLMGSIFDGGLLSMADHILEVAVALTRSIGEYQHAGLCWTHLPVLMRQPADNAIEVFDIQFSEFDAFTSSLSRLVGFLRNERIPEAPRRWYQHRYPQVAWAAPEAGLVVGWGLLALPVAALTTVSLPVVGSVLVGAAIIAGYQELGRRGNAGQVPGQTNEAFVEAQSRVKEELIKVQYQVTRILSSLGYAVPSSQLDFHSLQFTLDMAALCIQTLSLALQSFSQGFHGELEFSFLDRPVDGVLLRGLGVQNSDTIRAYRQKLTCLDGMTGGPVLVFEICTSETQTLPGVPREPCDLISSWENVEYIRGHRNKFEKIFRVSNFPWIRNGIIHPSQPLTESSNWHWTPETNPNFPQLLAQMRESFPKGISPSRKVRIGTITVNPLCPNSTREGQRAMRIVSRSYLHSIDGSEPRWKLNLAQIGLQVSPQYLATQAVWRWQKTSGRTKKQGIMDPGNVLRMSDLSKAWGIQVCLCTGVLRRSPLQQVIAECLEPYMADRYPKPPG
ncbi:hypothetical protein L207DRAFT_632679 [Hyaloscypha variabilis F]|uniref:Uncharacterized protein n=1 Tax=Hyaloscypha variabilis (strain UAMH 11265 / GT02V1 / F) TaxID=1149755 RepID=A0A2J6RRS4_HYAVF|nr:hypothetical protein L207DRAFT_632679 [Hyaloscypha variabilis F]